MRIRTVSTSIRVPSPCTTTDFNRSCMDRDVGEIEYLLSQIDSELTVLHSGLTCQINKFADVNKSVKSYILQLISILSKKDTP